MAFLARRWGAPEIAARLRKGQGQREGGEGGFGDTVGEGLRKGLMRKRKFCQDLHTDPHFPIFRSLSGDTMPEAFENFKSVTSFFIRNLFMHRAFQK